MSSTGDRKRAAREARAAAQAEAERRAAQRRRIAWTAGGFGTAAVVAAIAVVGAGGVGDDASRAALPEARTTDLVAAAKAAGGRFTSYDWDYGTGAHVREPVRYPQNPPTNGPHDPQWAADGNYAGHATPKTERLVHALEHGRIEIQYRPGLPAAQRARLVALYEESPEHVLLFENRTRMNADVAVTAWGHGLLFSRFTAPAIDAIRAFRQTYRDHGPETVM